MDREDEPPWPDEIKALLCLLKLLAVVVPLGLLGAFGIGSCTFKLQGDARREAAAHPAVHSSSYDAGYDAGREAAQAGQKPLSNGILGNLGRMRFPAEEGDFRDGYRRGFAQAP